MTGPAAQDLPHADIAVIGGSGFYSFFTAGSTDVSPDTPYGAPSAAISVGDVAGRRVAFLPRHGRTHEYSPHAVPYRANMWALRMLGVRQIFAPCAVGSLTPELNCGAVVVPDQIVDRTSGRVHTYFDHGGVHVQFADPYCPQLRRAALRSGVVDGGTMVVVQGPRFSTRAESQWYARQGWTLVNMTTYPEAVLARELEQCYVSVALVTDLDAGIAEGDGVRAIDVFAEFERNLEPFKALVKGAIADAPETPCENCRIHGDTPLPIELPTR